MSGDILLDTTQWNSAGTTTQVGSQNSTDVTNDVNTAIQSLNAVLNAAGFLDNAKNFVTVMEDFGEGMQAALACISVDLAVVSSGVTTAAAAFSALDAKLSSIFVQMDQQLPYVTNTASSVTLAQPTAAGEEALNSLLGLGNPSSSNPGITLSMPSSSSTAAAGGLLGVSGLLGALALLGLAF